jgi:signal transduction histidine kinase
MVDDLLDVSRITRGKIELQPRPIELRDIVVSALELAGPLLEQRQHPVDVQIPQHGAGVNADRARMAQLRSTGHQPSSVPMRFIHRPSCSISACLSWMDMK